MRFSFKLALVSIAIAFIALSTASVVLPPSEDFHDVNPYWNGLQNFFETVNATGIDAAVQGFLAEKSVLFVVGPTVEFSQQRMEALKKFVLEGGTLVVLDETGNVNPLLSCFGLGVNVHGCPMLDAVFYFNSWKLPKIIDVKKSDLTVGVEALVLNIPSVLNVSGSGVKVLAFSSSFSFLDLDGDGAPSTGEPSGPFVVAAEAFHGKGRVIVFSDSSLFLNGVISLGDNVRLLENMVAHKAVYVDVGVWHASVPTFYRSWVLKVYKVLAVPEVKYSLGFATVTVIYVLFHKEKFHSKGDEVDELVRRHPSWNRRLLQALKEARERIGR